MECVMLSPFSTCERDGECEHDYKCCQSVCGKLCFPPQKGKEWAGVDRPHCFSDLFSFKALEVRAYGMGTVIKSLCLDCPLRALSPISYGKDIGFSVALNVKLPVWVRAMGE